MGVFDCELLEALLFWLRLCLNGLLWWVVCFGCSFDLFGSLWVRLVWFTFDFFVFDCDCLIGMVCVVIMSCCLFTGFVRCLVVFWC